MRAGIPQTPLEHAEKRLANYQESLQNHQVDLMVRESELTVENYRNADDSIKLREWLEKSIAQNKENICTLELQITEWESIVAHFQGDVQV